MIEDLARQMSRLAWTVERMSNQERLKNNFSATTAPGIGDDSDDGYTAGSGWINQSAGDAYICISAAVGAAVWKKTTP